MPRVIRRCVPRVGGVPTMTPFLTCLFCLSKNGRVKNNWFFWNWVLLFALIGPRGERGQRERRAFMMSRRLWVFPSSVSFQWWRSWAFGIPRGCRPINSIMCLLFVFFLLHFSVGASSSTFCAPLFPSEALGFSAGDFHVLTWLHLRFWTLFFHFYTWYVYLLLSFPCCALVMLVVSGLLRASVFATRFLSVVSRVFYCVLGFLLPPCVFCGLGVLDCCVWLLFFLHVGSSSVSG